MRDYYNQPQQHITPIDHKPPIRPATGKLKELENLFLTTAKKRKQTTSTNEDLIRLFDKYKRLAPDEQQLKELEILI